MDWNEFFKNVSPAAVALFGYLAAKMALASKRATTDNEISKTSFKKILQQLDSMETEVKELREISYKYKELQDDYISLKEENNGLRVQIDELEAKVRKLESKEA